MKFLLAINLNPGKGTFARPFDSTQGIPSKAALFIFIGGVLLILYIIIRVWLSLKNGKK
jgi:hypothetical protein